MTPFDLWNATGCKPEQAAVFAKPIADAIQRWKIKSVSQFIAQTAHESAMFTKLEENLNYSAEALLRQWPHRFTRETAFAFGRTALQPANQREIANIAYANRYGNKGPETGMGWRYRGRGLIHLTFLDNYTRYQQATGIEAILHPDLLLEPRWAADSAGWFWSTHNLDGYDDVRRVTRVVNGGDNGIESRIALTKRAESVFA